MKKVFFGMTFTLAACMIFLIAVAFKENKSAPADSMPVGSVIYSVLPPDVFVTANPSWRPLDGRKIETDWKLSGDLKSNSLDLLGGNLPNASGTFLRAMNYNNVGEDPDKSRMVGGMQRDMVKEH